MPAGAPKKPPALKKVPVSLKLPRWMLEWMDTRPESRAVLIEEALKQQHGITPPNLNSTTPNVATTGD